MGITTEGFNASLSRWWCTGAGLCLGFGFYTIGYAGVNDWCSCAPAWSIVGNQCTSEPIHIEREPIFLHLGHFNINGERWRQRIELFNGLNILLFAHRTSSNAMKKKVKKLWHIIPGMVIVRMFIMKEGSRSGLFYLSLKHLNNVYFKKKVCFLFHS